MNHFSCSESALGRNEAQEAGAISYLRSVTSWNFATGTLSVAATIASFLLGTVNRHIVFNSDMMYLPMLFDDLFAHSGNFFSWYLTPAPGFFPDMLLFFTGRFLFRNTLLNFTIFAVFQVSLSFILALAIIGAFDSRKKERIERGQVFGIAFFTAISIFAARGIAPFVHIFLPVFRFGAVFNLLILSLCIFWTLDSRRALGRIGLCLICLLATATDIMFLPMAVVPAVLSIILTSWISKTLSKRLATFLSCILIFFSFLGWLVKQLISKNTMGDYIGIGITSFWDQARLLASMIRESFSQNILIAIFTIAFYLLVAFYLLTMISSYRSHPRENKDHISEKELYILFFLTISPAITFITVLSNGIISGHIHQLRYISNVYWLPIFFSWVAIRPLWRKWCWLNFFFRTWVTLACLQLFYAPTSGFSMDYYPPLVKCIDQTVSEYAVTNNEKINKGISLYWEAKLITHFSREKLSVLQVNSDASPFRWILNGDWYSDQTYDFAVLVHKAPQPQFVPTVPYLPYKDAIVSLNGQPKETKFCSSTDGGKFEIMFYGSDRLRIRT